MPGEAYAQAYYVARATVNRAHPLPTTRRMKVRLDDGLCPRRVLLTRIADLLAHLIDQGD